MTLIVLDLINTQFLDQAYARKDLLKYLTQSVNQREPTALYTLTRSGIHVIHDFADRSSRPGCCAAYGKRRYVIPSSTARERKPSRGRP